jgi:hypothetical protein
MRFQVWLQTKFLVLYLKRLVLATRMPCAYHPRQRAKVHTEQDEPSRLDEDKNLVISRLNSSHAPICCHEILAKDS